MLTLTATRINSDGPPASVEGSGVFPLRGRLIRWSGYAAVADTR
jgi:hypothetical protein